MFRRLRLRWINWRIRSLQFEVQVLMEVVKETRGEIRTLQVAAMAMNMLAIRQMRPLREKLDYYEGALRSVVRRLLTMKQSRRYMDLPREDARKAE